MDIIEKIIWVLVFAGVMTVWSMFGQPIYEGWVKSRGWTLGIGETYVGFFIPAVLTLLLTAILLRRTKKHES